MSSHASAKRQRLCGVGASVREGFIRFTLPVPAGLRCGDILAACGGEVHGRMTTQPAFYWKKSSGPILRGAALGKVAGATNGAVCYSVSVFCVLRIRMRLLRPLP